MQTGYTAPLTHDELTEKVKDYIWNAMDSNIWEGTSKDRQGSESLKLNYTLEYLGFDNRTYVGRIKMLDLIADAEDEFGPDVALTLEQMKECLNPKGTGFAKHPFITVGGMILYLSKKLANTEGELYEGDYVTLKGQGTRMQIIEFDAEREHDRVDPVCGFYVGEPDEETGERTYCLTAFPDSQLERTLP